MFILKIVKVLCFDTLLQVFILKGLGTAKVSISTSVDSKGVSCGGHSAERPFSVNSGGKRKEKYKAETPRPGRGNRRTQRIRREEWDGANRASWRLTIKDYGSTDVMQLSSTY